MTYKIETPKTHMHKDETNIFKKTQKNTGKLSEFENDLFYIRETPVITITKDKLVEMEIDGERLLVYIHDGLWPGKFEDGTVIVEATNGHYTHRLECYGYYVDDFDHPHMDFEVASIVNGGEIVNHPDDLVILFYTNLDAMNDDIKFILYQKDVKQIPFEVLPCTEIKELRYDHDTDEHFEAGVIRKIVLMNSAFASQRVTMPGTMLVYDDGTIGMYGDPTFIHPISNVFDVSNVSVGGTVKFTLSQDYHYAQSHSSMWYTLHIEDSDGINSATYQLLDKPVCQGRNAVVTHTGKVFKSYREEDGTGVKMVIERIK